ncbi:pH-response regulator protein palA/RIM20 [Polytolypa hystricis UAMH7299]|uniref:pH-response regulator protein palA/RIM20 n=1 Tax=Polytolypa hystricis (strain UAMH7299) TaxID=1447883 RepID=A0A2B7YH05_POLH7|nr:pH-response regulator protein palA/RIM20 [Polytolypa hystricis UAMH7299]
MFAEDMLIIDRLRTDAVNVQEPHVTGISRLVAYAAQLKWIVGKFPIDVGVDFAWYPTFGFNISTPVVQNNLRYELANILFNLAALYSQLAVNIQGAAPDSLKTACKYFCQAAGVMVHLRVDILPDLRSEPPEDMDEMTLRSLEELLLAQAQECFWQKAVKDGLKDASIARLAAKVSDLYASAGECGVKSNAISVEWIHHMTAKHHHFAAAAQYRQSLDCLEKRKYGEEIARLRDSLSCVNEALKESKWINRVVLGDMNGLKNKVVEDLKRAEKDNNMIYLIPVPPKSELKILDRATMVGAKAPAEVTDALSMLGDDAPLGRPLFAKLVPYTVHVAASIYADRRDRLVNQTIIVELESMTTKLRDLLQSLNLPGSLQALEKPLGLPPAVVSHAEEMRQQDALNRIRRSLEDTAKLKANDKAIYTEGVELLMAEREEDDRARTKYGTDRWARDPSDIVSKKLYTQISEIDGYLKSAQSSDGLVEGKLRDSEHIFRILTGTNRDMEAYVPSSRRATITPQVERESARLRACLNDVSRLESRRKRKIEALKDKAKSDDINRALLRETARLEREFPMQKIEAGQFEDLFEEQLRVYDSDRAMLSEEETHQQHIEQSLREANTAFTSARRGDTSTRDREKALQDLENGYLKYKEIISNVEVGRTFYNDLARLVGRFREECKKFVHQRRMEASQMEMDITNTTSMASLNISQHQPPQHQPPPQPEYQYQPTHQPPSTPLPPPPSTPFTTAHRPSFAEPLTAPQPTRAAQIPMPNMPNMPMPIPVAAIWSPERGIKFGAPTGMGAPSTNTTTAAAAAAVSGAAREVSPTRRRGPPLPPPQPQPYPTAGQWDPSRGVRFS